MNTSIRTRAPRWLMLPALAGLIGCTSEYTLVSIANPSICGSSCETTMVGTFDNTTVASENLGFAVEVAAWGTGGSFFAPTIDKSNRTVAAGAPNYINNLNARAGRVWALPANVNTGALNTSATPWMINAPNSNVRELGYAIVASDVRSGHQTSTQVGQVINLRNVSYGEELVIGAPGSYDNIGAVEWYENQGVSPQQWLHGGELRPTNGIVGERFGASVAAPITFDARYPDTTTSSSPPWIAVGSPGRGSVYVYMVIPGVANPFTQLQRIDGPAGATGFGSSITIADFNADGFNDLAVGAPGAAAGAGRVYVYTGQVGFTPINPMAVVTVAPIAPVSAGGEFGFSLAAGFFRRNDTSRPALAAGLPGYNHGASTASGALCQMQFSGATGSPMTVTWQRCDDNPTPGSNERYAHALAVGNFNASSGSGSTTGACATGEELAVGIPGDPNGITLPAAGAVKVLGLGLDGAEPAFGGTAMHGTRALQYFGRALASDFVQRTLYEDLVVGSPLFTANRGSFSLTRAQSPGGMNDPISGTWASTDSAGNPFSVRAVWDSSAATLDVTMLGNATVTARNGGSVCNVLGTPVDFTGVFPFPTVPWTSTAVTHSEHVVVPVGGGVNVEVDLTYNAATSRFTLDIDEGAFPLSLMSNNCDIVNEPFVFNRTAANTCE